MREHFIAYGFIHAGDIALDPAGVLRFNLLPAFLRRGEHHAHHGWVYLWTGVHADGVHEVFYVGKAGKALTDRCSQHLGGFGGGSKKGVRLAQHLREFFGGAAGRCVHVYARKSPTAVMLDEPDITLCEAEERAMIAKMRRVGATLWNA